MKRRHLLQVAVGSALPAISARAQVKPLTLAVGYAAGSGVDLVARRTAERLSALLRRTVVVDNRAGAGGQLALSAAVASTDGSVLAFTPGAALTLAPLTNDRLPYQAKDFVPVGATCSAEAGLVVANSHPASTFTDFLAWSETHSVSIGNPGVATGPHFNVWRLAQVTGMAVQHVPYRATPQMAIEISSGQLAAGFASIPAFVELVKGGRLKLLATAGNKRTPLFPQVPTFAELGYPGVYSVEWYGIVGSVRTPESGLTEVGKALSSIGNDPAYRDAIQASGLVAEYSDANALKQRMKEETARWSELVKQTGFKSSS